MNSTIWLALCWKVSGRCFAKALEEMISAMTNLPDNILRRFGGGFMVAALWSTHVEKNDWLNKNRLIRVILVQKVC